MSMTPSEAALHALSQAAKEGRMTEFQRRVEMNISEIIKPIELLSGSHKDTGETGRGCFMNVIAYLNGEKQITDESECVCFVVRPIVIWLNDFLSAQERARMIPYIERAMGSRSDDPAIFVPRAEAAALFARLCSDVAQKSAGKASAWASASARARARASAIAWAASESASARQQIIEGAFKFLDECLPEIQQEAPAIVVQRAEKLVSLVGNPRIAA